MAPGMIASVGKKALENTLKSINYFLLSIGIVITICGAIISTMSYKVQSEFEKLTSSET